MKKNIRKKEQQNEQDKKEKVPTLTPTTHQTLAATNMWYTDVDYIYTKHCVCNRKLLIGKIS